MQKSRCFLVNILVADKNNLKKIYKSHSHQADATALQTLAEIFRNSFRDEDMVARIGGEELAVFLLTTYEQAAHQAINRLVNALAY